MSNKYSINEIASKLKKVKPVNNTAFPPNYRKKMVEVLCKKALHGLKGTIMRLISLIYLFLLVPVFSVQSVSAQPDFEVGDWDIGFKDGENITKELDEDGDVSVEFW